MKREIWKDRKFTNKAPSQYPCPVCYKGTLGIGNVSHEPTKNGKLDAEFNTPNGVENLTTGTFICSESSCREIVAFIAESLQGIEFYYVDTDGQNKSGYINQYRPKYFYPNLKMFELPHGISEELKDSINQSFSFFFSDLSSCANKIRTSIEILLNDVKAAKSKEVNGQRRKLKTLHSRIEHFKTKNKTVAELCLAIKIIGNEGSHNGTVEIIDILDAYEILEQTIDVCFAKNGKRVLSLARTINSNRKPRSKD